ncbi:ABC transporter ATP-binding protein [Haematobacter massiliensis]|uniref:ABC transporter ATP-binding protein n=1 Tax=Haematobacter massiliensis TaxID=195105 RepID=A0A086Y293_9RHOB|nr:ABC transporter ATP-binding protein [Haematobacter massiliensis]KFI28393.1 ABC transporter ATP-binding protein [Haematobacter massiliensis]OWJ84666.1 ABC transporter ATP-binding protein [Haematobacter massiliensis]QBJ26369.1 ABC transporter ATP-binding protein [Haematobacter massiliensis]
MAEPLLSLSGVHTHIQQYHILQGVDLAVPRGGITALLGRNGAGKTTTLRTIMGLWRASSGSIRFAGQEIGGAKTPRIARLGIAYVPEGMGIFGGLTVQENLRLAAIAGRFDEARLERIFEVFPALKHFWQRPAGLLSGGQKQMAAIARAIIEPRDLLLVDEPTKGLAPAIVEAMGEALARLSHQTTILLVEQNFDFVTGIAEHCAVIDDGRIVHAGAMAALASDSGLQGRLLGMSGIHAI